MATQSQMQLTESERDDRADLPTALGVKRRARGTSPVDLLTPVGGPQTLAEAWPARLEDPSITVVESTAPLPHADPADTRVEALGSAPPDPVISSACQLATPIGSPPAELRPGDRIRGYVIKEMLAAGGFGTVYLVEHEVLGRPAALKVLHPDLAGSVEAASRFEREARLVGLIRHHNVVDVHAFGRLPDGRSFFVMEYLEGEDLDSRLRSRGRLSPEQVLDVFEPLCNALEVVHQHGIIHRDLKASNIFLAQENGQSRVVLLDFGVAKLLNDEAPELTTSRHVIGTPVCMAPEQIRGAPIDRRSDVYALGALAYHALTGSLPFSDESPVMVQHLHLHAQPPRPGEQVAVSAALDSLVVRAMAKNREDRPATALEFLSELRAAIATPRSSRSHELARSVCAIGVYLEIIVEDEHLADPDEALLSDIDELFPRASDFLTASGFVAAAESGSSLLFVKPLPEDASAEIEARRECVASIQELRRMLARRTGRDPRIHINLSLERGPVLMTNRRALSGCLLRPGRWASSEKVEGTVGSAGVFAELDIATEAVAGAPHLLRIAPIDV